MCFNRAKVHQERHTRGSRMALGEWRIKYSWNICLLPVIPTLGVCCLRPYGSETERKILNALPTVGCSRALKAEEIPRLIL